MRLDHLLSKEEEVRVLYTVESWIRRSVSALESEAFSVAATPLIVL